MGGGADARQAGADDKDIHVFGLHLSSWIWVEALDARGQGHGAVTVIRERDDINIVSDLSTPCREHRQPV